MCGKSRLSAMSGDTLPRCSLRLRKQVDAEGVNHPQHSIKSRLGPRRKRFVQAFTAHLAATSAHAQCLGDMT